MSIPAYDTATKRLMRVRRRWERRVNPLDSGLENPRYQRRQMRTVEFRAECDPMSAVNGSTSAAVALDVATLTDPEMIVADTFTTDGQLTPHTEVLNGTWSVDEVDIDLNDPAKAVISVALFQTDDEWQDDPENSPTP